MNFKIYVQVILLSLIAWPALVSAETGISTSLTVGPDNYLANYSDLSFSLAEKVNLDLNYSYSVSDLNKQPAQTFGSGLNAMLNDNFSLRGNFSLTPHVSGFKASGYGLGFTFTFLGLPNIELPANPDFQTALDFDYSAQNNVYDVHTDSFTVYYRGRGGRYRSLYIAAKDSTETIKQIGWTLGVTETFYADLSLYLGYSNYDYNPDIEADILLYKARQNNAILFTLSPGLGGFPKNSYEARISKNLSPQISVALDYLRLQVLQFSYNDNGTPFNGTVSSLLDDFYEVRGVGADSYTLNLDYYLTSHLTINAGYNLYKEAYLDHSSYYTLGAAISF